MHTFRVLPVELTNVQKLPIRPCCVLLPDWQVHPSSFVAAGMSPARSQGSYEQPL